MSPMYWFRNGVSFYFGWPSFAFFEVVVKVDARKERSKLIIDEKKLSIKVKLN